MAHFSRDENLINAFHNGLDLHGNTAKLMFRLDCEANEVKKKYPQLRQMGKVIALLLQYGGSVIALEETLNSNGMLTNMLQELKTYKSKKDLPDTLKPFWGCKKTKDMAQALMDAYFEAFPGIANFMRKQKKAAHRNEYVMTVLGRKRRLPFINQNDPKMTGYAERLSLNAPIQGSGADIMINAQINVSQNERLKELGCKMLVQIHDELLFSCPKENCEEAIQVIRECMIYPFGREKLLNLPLDIGAGHGKSYAAGH